MLSIIIPTINEERSIGAVVDRIKKAMLPVGEEYEIIVVDTNSKDKTVEIAKEAGCRVISEPERGYGRAYMTGFREAKGDTIVTLDADASYPPEAIPELLAMFKKEGLDFLTADRFTKMDRGAMDTTHKLGNWILNLTTRMLFNVKIMDSQSGMWVLRRDIVPALNMKSNGFPFSEEIKIKAAKHFAFKEVPVSYSLRTGEKKLNTWKDGWNNLKFLIRLRMSREI
ncbi:MAG: glycosyltransferase family 2 protein [Methanomassiliicoccales archaeon]